MIQTEKIHITGLSRFESSLERLAEHNPLYDLSVAQLAGQGMIGKQIYENLYTCARIQLVLEAPPAAVVPAGTVVPPAIRVLADDLTIGYVKQSSCAKVHALLTGGQIRQLSLDIRGGRYKLLLPQDDDSIEMAADTAGFFALLSVSYETADEEKKAETSGSGWANDDDSSKSGDGTRYISTSYAAAQQRPQEQRARGFAALLLAAILTVFYLSFSGPYWFMIRRGLRAPLSLFGPDIADQLLYPHLILVAAALIVMILGLILRHAIWPALAAGLLSGSLYTVPGYAVILLLPLLFCVISALQRQTSSVPVRLIRALLLLGALGFTGYCLYPAALHLMQTRTFVISPTGQYDELTGLDEEYDEFADDEFSDEDFEDDGFDDGGFDDGGFDDGGFDDADFADDGFDDEF